MSKIEGINQNQDSTIEATLQQILERLTKMNERNTRL